MHARGRALDSRRPAGRSTLLQHSANAGVSTEGAPAMTKIESSTFNTLTAEDARARAQAEPDDGRARSCFGFYNTSPRPHDVPNCGTFVGTQRRQPTANADEAGAPEPAHAARPWREAARFHP